MIAGEAVALIDARIGGGSGRLQFFADLLCVSRHILREECRGRRAQIGNAAMRPPPWRMIATTCRRGFAANIEERWEWRRLAGEIFSMASSAVGAVKLWRVLLRLREGGFSSSRPCQIVGVDVIDSGLRDRLPRRPIPRRHRSLEKYCLFALRRMERTDLRCGRFGISRSPTGGLRAFAWSAYPRSASAVRMALA